MVLCSVLFLTIVGLQLYFSVSKWRMEEEIFQRKANEALHKAKDKTLTKHMDQTAELLASYLRDSTRITCHWNAEASKTAFTLVDIDTSSPGQHRLTLSLGQISERYDTINETIREKFILQFCKNVKDDLKDGAIWYYTVNIGNYLEKHYLHTPIHLSDMSEIYRKELEKMGIKDAFSVNSRQGWKTQQVDLSLYKPQGPLYYQASFDPPFAYFIKQQYLSLLASLLLILLAAGTAVTVYRTLYNQEKLSREKDLFIANLTHELQTPVSAIQLATEAMQQLQCSEEERKNFLQLIAKNTSILQQACTEILHDFRAGKSDGAPELLSLRSVLEKVSTQYPRLGTVLEAEKELTVFADLKQISRVFSNLFDNALKYNTSADPRLHIRIKEENKKVSISLQDNGIGIPATFQSRIFERFYRVPAVDLYAIRGYGIGLSYVKNTVEAWGGTVKVSSQPHQGTTFQLEWPL